MVYGEQVRRNQILSVVLNSPKKDSKKIIRLARKNESITLHYDGRINTPREFKHCEFKNFGGIGYFRINKWNLEVYLRIMNYWEEINSSSSLIIDLRNNGGGEYLSVLRTLSLFFNEPTLLFREKTGGDFRAFVLAQNGRNFYSSYKPIVILINEMTACSSESFAISMKNRGLVSLVGSAKSYGSDAARYNILFPSGFRLYVNCLANKTIFRDNVIIENAGIEPDILVPILRVTDLRNYDDAVLKYSIDYLTSFKKNHLKNYENH